MKIIVENGIVAGTCSNDYPAAAVCPGGFVLPVPDGSPVEIGQAWPVTLEQARASVCDAIDAEAERRRGLVLTPGSGQMAAYQAKEAQALDYLESDAPADVDYPDLVNEVGITADSLAGVAHAVMRAAAAWRVYGRRVERARLAAKKAVDAAEDVLGVITARDGTSWPEI